MIRIPFVLGVVVLAVSLIAPPAGTTGELQAQPPDMTGHDHLMEVACEDVPPGEKRPEFGCFNIGTVKDLRFQQEAVYWHLHAFETRKAADAAKSGTGLVVEEDGRVWLSEFGARDAAPRGGEAVAVVGPLQLPKAKSYSAVLSYAVMRPGDSSRVHTHPGPEGWYVIAGEQCLETPAGADRAGAGKTMTVPPNVPMELNVTGTTLRRAFALVIHDSIQARGIPSTWKPSGKCGPAQAQAPGAQTADAFAEMDRAFDEYRLDAHIPGMFYGVVMDGRLVHAKGLGVQDLETKRPVTADTLFRIASMTKSFTALSILNLRDAGRLSLDAPAETYIPEIRGWRYPTEDSPRIRVRDLLTHTSGFVTDDPWGDRQTPLPEADFTRLLSEGVPFTRPPGTAMEYSNLGYAMLGRVVANVAQEPYKDYVQRTLLGPLGMTSSGFEFASAPAERRALGYRWEDDKWSREPDMAHGAFGAMGGLQTSATDYAKYVAWLLSAWPPRDGADAGPVKRSSVRELAQGANFPVLRQRYGKSGASACRQAAAYAMGMIVTVDCDLGATLSHGGGYPGYGSHVLLLPDYGIGIFALANRTYAGPRGPVWDAALALQKAGLLKARPIKVDDALAKAYAATARIYAGGVTSGGDVLAMNFLLDRSAEGWARELAALKAQVGSCETNAPVVATGALSGNFTWRCERGRVRGTLLLAPTQPPRIQSLSLTRAAP